MRPPKQSPPVCCESHLRRYMPIPDDGRELEECCEALRQWTADFWLPDEGGRASREDLPFYVARLVERAGTPSREADDECPKCDGEGSYTDLADCTTGGRDCACNGPRVRVDPCPDCEGTGRVTRDPGALDPTESPCWCGATERWHGPTVAHDFKAAPLPLDPKGIEAELRRFFIEGDQWHADGPEYRLVNLLEALEVVADTGDWHAEAR